MKEMLNHQRPKNWVIAPVDKIFQENICTQFQVSAPIAQILYNRQLGDINAISGFLTPKLANIKDPFLLPDMERAILRTYEAFVQKEKIIVFGDYDVDGITSVSLLCYIFSSFDIDFSYYIPHRVKEGYGLSKEGIQWCHKQEANLIITVDCGSNNAAEIAFAKSLNIDVIVLDHHELKGETPSCVGVVNPKRKDAIYSFIDLAGVGVVFKFAHALIKFLTQENYAPHIEIDLKEHLDLVALGTLADIMPLRDENRIFVKFGLDILKNSQKIGILSLIKKIGRENQNISEFDVCYKIAPRINAIGRLGDPALAVKLLTTHSKIDAEFLVEVLESHNQERQSIEREILQIAFDKAEQDHKKIIIIEGENWHAGVIGIVASKIVEKFFKPAIIISLEDNIGRGSGRSIKTFSLIEALSKQNSLLKSFGGHNQAVGLTIKRENIPQFKEKINRFADETISEDNFIPEIAIDLEISLEKITPQFIEELSSLAPFGSANPQPLMVARNLWLVTPPQIVGEKHLKAQLSQNSHFVDVIGFGMAHLYNQLRQTSGPLDIVFFPQINYFKQKETIQLVIKDLKVLD